MTSFPAITTYSCPVVTVIDVEHLSIEGDVDAEVEVLPMPEFPEVVLRQPLTLNQLALRDPTAGTGGDQLTCKALTL